MKGDRERCLQAGMDAYASKPILARDLFAAMESVLLSHQSSVVSRQSEEEKKAGPVLTDNCQLTTDNSKEEDVFDRAAALERVGGDQELLRELIEMFLAELPGWLTELRQAIDRRDLALIKRAAHTIKGAVSTFAAESAVAAVVHLETMGRDADLAGVEAAWIHFRTMLDQLVVRLRSQESVLRSP
jgi:HPt (histidine-containing phosphotransfer) domain-containing protein